MGSTPVYAIPYVEPGDHPNVWPAADQAAAERLDSVIPQIASGLTAAVFAAAASTTFAVTFPAGRFTAAPTVIGFGRSGSGVYAYVSAALTATGCTMTARTMAGGVLSATVNGDWIAARVA